MKSALSVAFAATALAAAMVLSSSVISKFLVKVTHEKTIDVKGYAEKNVVSDVGKFYCSYRATDPNLQNAYARLGSARELVVKYLQNAGFSEDELSIRNIDTTTLNKRDEKGNLLNLVEYFSLSQGIQVTSPRVALVNEASRNVTELIKEGIEVSTSEPEFHVSDLKDLKIKLLAEATSDGHRRARMLASNSGSALGALTSAHQGVFQITERNSTETSDYGMYDTTTIDKTVKAVVSLEYEVVAVR